MCNQLIHIFEAFSPNIAQYTTQTKQTVQFMCIFHISNWSWARVFLSLSAFLSFPLSPKPFPPLSRSSSHHFTKFRIKHVICCWCWIRSSMFFFRRDYCKISLERTCYQGWEKKCIEIEWKEMDKIEAKTIPIQGYCWRQNTRWWSMIYCHLYGTSNFQWNINSKHIVHSCKRAHMPLASFG